MCGFKFILVVNKCDNGEESVISDDEKYTISIGQLYHQKWYPYSLAGFSILGEKDQI